MLERFTEQQPTPHIAGSACGVDRGLCRPEPRRENACVSNRCSS